MTQRKAHKIAKTFYAIARDPRHPAQHRNALHQTAAHHKCPETRVQTALFITSPRHTQVHA